MTEKRCLVKGCGLPPVVHDVWCEFHKRKSLPLESSFEHVDKRTGVPRQIPLVRRLNKPGKKV